MKTKKDTGKIMLMIGVCIILFIVALMLSLGLSTVLQSIIGVDQASMVSEIASGFIAIIALGFVYFQMRESDKFEQASFFLRLNQMFIQDEKIAEIETALDEQANYGRTQAIITTPESRQKVVNYLVYFDGLAPLVLNHVIDLEFIDDIMAFRFFMAVNNKELQTKELFRYPGDYRGCFKLYKKWAAYRSMNNLKIHLAENALDKWEFFDEIIENKNVVDAVNCEQLKKDTELEKTELEDIAKLIYGTDPYVYHDLFMSENNAIKIIQQLLNNSYTDNMFRKDNLFICRHVKKNKKKKREEKGKIIGLILWNEGKLNWKTKDFCDIAEKDALDLKSENINDAKTRYFDVYKKENINTDTVILINVCVDSSCRGLGIGRKMLSKFIENKSNSKMMLTVLEDNSFAIKLYEKNGFRKTKSYYSRSFANESINCIEMHREVP